MFRKRNPPAGSHPGALMVDSEAAKPRIYVIDFNHQRVREIDIIDLDILREFQTSETVTWIDVQGLGDASVLDKIAEIFGIHPLTMEDVVNIPSRPKADLYENYLQIVTNLISMEAAPEVEIEQVSIILGETFVITFHERSGDILLPVRERIRKGKASIRRGGHDYLTYAIIDAIIDSYYPVLEQLGEYLEQLEDSLLEGCDTLVVSRIYRVKRTLLALRRIIWPQREALNFLIKEEDSPISDPVALHLRDCYDHCVQTIDVIEIYRELCAGLTDLYVSSASNRTNEIMQVLTIISTIFIPLSFVAGVYGMNFEYMPELKFKYSYPIFWVIILAISGVMLYNFHKRGWLRRLPKLSHLDGAEQNEVRTKISARRR